MNVASLELCKELYELSGWRLTYFNHHQFQNHSSPEESRHIVHTTLGDNNYGLDLESKTYVYQLEITPAYDLGYLLRKLPPKLKHPATGNEHTLGVAIQFDTQRWLADYQRSMLPHARADTPEDALCKLAIELFKQGVLTTHNRIEKEIEVMSKKMYCVVGDYGIEFASESEKEAQDFIAAEVAGTGHGDNPADPDYYHITTMTKAELDALPEV